MTQIDAGGGRRERRGELAHEKHERAERERELAEKTRAWKDGMDRMDGMGKGEVFRSQKSGVRSRNPTAQGAWVAEGSWPTKNTKGRRGRASGEVRSETVPDTVSDPHAVGLALDFILHVLLPRFPSTAPA